MECTSESSAVMVLHSVLSLGQAGMEGGWGGGFTSLVYTYIGPPT